jgi:hypothetical protein
VLLEQIIELSQNGLTNAQVAHCLRISPQTLLKNADASDEVAAALAQGRSIGVRRVANKLFEDALEGNTRAQMFYLKAVGGWRETETAQVSVADRADAAFAAVEKEEMARLKTMKEEGQAALQQIAEQLSNRQGVVN